MGHPNLNKAALLTATLFFSLPAWPCEDQITRPSALSLLVRLHETGTLQFEELQRVLSDLLTERRIRPFKDMTPSTEMSLIQRIFENMDSLSLEDQKEMQLWLKAVIRESQMISSKQLTVTRNTQETTWRRGNFITISVSPDWLYQQYPWIASDQRAHGSEFEVMDVPVTQWMWKKVMGNNPSYHQRTPGQWDRPVENISLMEMKNFVSQLNHPDMNQEILQTLFRDHSSEFIYMLPNRAIYAFLIHVITNGKRRGPYVIDEADLPQHIELSANDTREVEGFAPLNIMGQPIYSLLGNVTEVFVDAWSEYGNQSCISDYFGAHYNTSDAALTWYSITRTLCPKDEKQVFRGNGNKAHVQGFRLVRYRKSP